MSRGVASRGCVVWVSAVGVAPCGPSLVRVVCGPVLYCIVLYSGVLGRVVLLEERRERCAVARRIICYAMLCYVLCGVVDK